MDEFSLVEHYFASCGVIRPEVVLGIGDDAAILSIPSSYQQVISTDTLVEGRHFTNEASPRSIGHKALAVNLSDLAAMAAEPVAVMLSLTLPDIDKDWLAEFSHGFCKLAVERNVQLIGGDISRGSLSITAQVMGQVANGHAVLRSGAITGDEIYVSGALGDAALALAIRNRVVNLEKYVNSDCLNHALDQPEPRNELGLALVGIATSAVDISDGLIADLGHICDSSGCGASVLLEQVPLSEQYRSYLNQTNDWTLALAGGDDYELCFTSPFGNSAQIAQLSNDLGLAITQIGTITAGDGVQVMDKTNSTLNLQNQGYQHFVN